ncbi:hypothetical protein SGLAM104S_09855 [Streptomyces glaucescens]
MDGKHMQIGEVAARTELSLRTIRHYEETGLVVPSARSQGGFRLYTENDVARLMVIRRMKPLGFTLDQMRDLLDATDRLDAGERLTPGEREALLERVRAYERTAAEQVEKLRVQLARAEDFAATLRARLPESERLGPDGADAGWGPPGSAGRQRASSFRSPSSAGTSANESTTWSGSPLAARCVCGKYFPVRTSAPVSPARCAASTSDSMSSPTMTASSAPAPSRRSAASKNACRRLPGHHGLGPGRLLEPGQERPRVQPQSPVGTPEQIAVHGHEPGPVPEVPEGPVERLVPELRPGTADQYDVHSALGGLRADQAHTLQIRHDVPAVQQEAARTRTPPGEIRGGDEPGAVRMSSALTGNPASASVPAIDARVRDVVLVTRANGSPAARISRSASTAPGSGSQETVRTPSMSTRTARTGTHTHPRRVRWTP